MADDYETLLGMAAVLQWTASDVYARGWSDTACRLYAQARALYAGAEALRREREATRVREVAGDLRAWSNGALASVTGMGAGLHAEMWPHIGPAAAKLLRELADRLEQDDD